jgi:hypothetical protein
MVVLAVLGSTNARVGLGPSTSSSLYVDGYQMCMAAVHDRLTTPSSARPP